ncbi:TadE/TadG family type IV pilus assembly protein [Desulfofalx alkaliphila]|uniref:TadE/TadG family type IV pilus assembly protein n=1 Tax=Desulfofalx alkaliphila TaxID=105483 RepID=UPI0004E268E0|nr:TadE family protein [Desulfofalx alkaliphila]
MKRLVTDQRGQAIIEFALIFIIFMGVLMALFIHGSWMYNKFHTDRAARQAALYLASTDDKARATQIAREHLEKTIIFSDIKEIRVYWNGNSTVGRVRVEMETFFPGMAKLINSANPTWSGKVMITKEVTTPGEHKFTHSHEYSK